MRLHGTPMPVAAAATAARSVSGRGGYRKDCGARRCGPCVSRGDGVPLE